MNAIHVVVDEFCTLLSSKVNSGPAYSSIILGTLQATQ